MITNPMKTLTYANRLTALTLMASLFGGVSRGQAPAGPPASGRTVVVSDLQSSCRPEAVQALATKLSMGITVKEIPLDPKLPGGTKYVAAASALPAYCQVTGSFVTNPKTGKTANFLAIFAAEWNGKFLQVGCSGHCGSFAVSNVASGASTITCQGSPGDAIRKGYATFATDEGHVGMGGGDWAIKGPGQIDEDAVEDFYYRADQVLAHMGKAFTAAFYGQASGAAQKIARSYFIGCSGGGRDALVATSFFPEEFDGLIAGSPYADPVGVSFQGAGLSVASRKPGAAIPPALMSKVDTLVKAKCDEVDGVKDGLIQNPAACDFRPDRDLPRCEDNAPTGECFTQAQIETISTLVSAVTDERGVVVQPGYAISELQAGAAALSGLGDAIVGIFVHKNDPNFHLSSTVKLAAGGPGPITNFHTIAPRKEIDAAKASARMGIGSHPELMGKLIKQNRKLLIWENLSDTTLSPYMAINYYRQAAKLYGGYSKLQNNVRLFGIPGTGHCSMNGIAPNNFDALTAIEEWVEKGKAPDALPATMRFPGFGGRGPTAGGAAGAPLRTMPLCKYPEMAKYSGQGDVNDGANWSCPASDNRMLKVGESGRQAGVVE